MKGIRFKINLIVCAALALSAYFGWRTYLSFKDLENAQLASMHSLKLKTAAIESHYAPSKLIATEALRGFYQTSSPSIRDRIKAISQAHSQRDFTMQKKISLEIALEQDETIREATKKIASSRTDIKRFAVFSLSSSLVTLAWLLLTLRSNIFKPLDRLSRRMMDFLIDRYSFQFSQPESSALGDLQRTFNSLAQRVINTMDELKSLDQAKSDFVNITSHELRTPLTSIKGSLSLLASGVMGNLDANSMRLIKIAETETDRLIRLINDLLDLAKIEAGHLPLNRHWSHWNEVTAKTAEGLAGLALNSNVKIHIDTIEGLEVFMDRDRIHQVLTNLISNAIKFSPRDSVVAVSCGASESGELVISVIDQGPGIAPNDQSLIFQKFRQGSGPESTIVKGTGLGLAIAKALVEEHGGEIGVASTPGHGATFWFTLPEWRERQNNVVPMKSESESQAATPEWKRQAA